MQSAKDIIAGMDFDSILKETGADKPKQTRPNDAKWLNNAIQVKMHKDETDDERWVFWEGYAQTLNTPPNFGVIGVIEHEFMESRKFIEVLRLLYPERTFRLVAILEVK